MSATYKKILVPLDGSELAAQALPHAEELAREMGAQLILFRVLETSPLFMAALPAVGGGGVGGGAGVNTLGVATILLDDDGHTQAIDDLKQSLDDLVTSLKHRKVDAEAEIDTGDPTTRIVDYAATHDVDLIVMSSHGRTGLARWAYGSVANKVRQTASCEVMVVRPSFSKAQAAGMEEGIRTFAGK
jgi:nucleotide-binding universal stress UspA family protein